MKLEELNVYNLSMELGDQIWDIVKEWDNFTKNSIGDQMIRAVDSIAANISEGFGRYHYLDSKKFYYYSRGSLYETKTWITKAFKRNLINEDNYNSLINDIDILAIKLNNYINSIGKKLPKTTANKY